MQKWKFALSSADSSPATAPILLNGSIEENLMTAGSLGYDAIEVHMREDACLDYDKILRVMEETGVKISMIVTGRLNTEGKCSLMDDIPYVAQAAMAGLSRYIDIAARLNAGLVLGWAKGNVPPGKPRRPYMERLGTALKELDKKAGEKNVPINIEVINRYETNVFNTAKETIDFIKEHGLKNCYVHLDTFHMNIEEDDFSDAIRTVGDHLGYFHVADSNRHAVGDGRLDFQGILQSLKEIGYEGYISVECLPIPDGMSAARISLARLNEFLETKNQENV